MVTSSRGPILIDSTSELNDLFVKTLAMGDWDMVSDGVKSFAHGLDITKVVAVSGMLRNDDDSKRFPLGKGMPRTAYIIDIDATNVNISREPTSLFDSVDFDSTNFNRGWISIFHTN